MCRTRPVEILTDKLAFCERCNRKFYVMLEDAPCPDSKAGKTECGRKVRHDSIDSAKVHAMEVASKPELPHRVKARLCVYLCRICSKWHVGHKGGRKQKVSVFKLLSELVAAEN